MERVLFSVVFVMLLCTACDRSRFVFEPHREVPVRADSELDLGFLGRPPDLGFDPQGVDDTRVLQASDAGTGLAVDAEENVDVDNDLYVEPDSDVATGPDRDLDTGHVPDGEDDLDDPDPGSDLNGGSDLDVAPDRDAEDDLDVAPDRDPQYDLDSGPETDVESDPDVALDLSPDVATDPVADPALDIAPDLDAEPDPDLGTGVDGGPEMDAELDGYLPSLDAIQILPPEGVRSFGISVALDSDRLLVGSLDDSGHAYLYEFDGSEWLLEHRFDPPSPVSNSRFGESLDLQGDRAVFGASLYPDRRVGAGYAFVHRWSEERGWQLEQSIRDPISSNDGSFGYKVRIDYPHLLAGGWREFDDDGDFLGSTYVYRHTGTSWNLDERLMPPLDPPFIFGAWHDLEGGLIMAPDILDDDADYNAGALYVWALDDDGAWGLTQKVLPVPASRDGRLGINVRIGGRYAVADANGSGSAGKFVHVLRQNDSGVWASEQALLVPGTAESNGRDAAAVHAPWLLMGACAAERGSGMAYLYRRGEDGVWALAAQLPGDERSDQHGFSVALDDTWLVVTDIEYERDSGTTGAVWVYRLADVAP